MSRLRTTTGRPLPSTSSSRHQVHSRWASRDLLLLLLSLILLPGCTKSIESREAAALALCQLRAGTLSRNTQFLRVLLRLVQDDDVTVRDYAGEVVSRLWTNGVPVSERKSVEMVLMASQARSVEQDRTEIGASIRRPK